MVSRPTHGACFALAAAMFVFAAAACAPAAPTPTAAPAKPAVQPTTAPAKVAATTPPAKTEAKPAASPAVKTEVKPAASPAAKSEAKPAGSPAAKPAGKASFDEKAVADFYRGKTIRVVVGFAPGGGFDNYSRLIARHITKYIPGNPLVVVENMPGASSMLAMNTVAKASAKDGTVIGNVIGTLALNQLFNLQGVEFDMTKLNYVGVPNVATYLGWFHQRAGVTKWDQVVGPNAKEVVLGTDAPGSTVHDGPVMLKEVLGAKFKLVPGFGGTSQIRLAVDRGEVDGIFNAWDSMKITSLEDIQKGVYVPLLQLSVDKINAPELKDVPGINDLTQDPEKRQLLKFGLDSPNKFLRLYVLPDGTPQDRVAALQDAFLKTMDDKDFQADAVKGKFDVAPIPGPNVRGMVTEMLSMPADIKDKLRKVLGQ